MGRCLGLLSSDAGRLVKMRYGVADNHSNGVNLLLPGKPAVRRRQRVSGLQLSNS